MQVGRLQVQLTEARAQTKEYQLRCQAWADQKVARDRYVHWLERNARFALTALAAAESNISTLAPQTLKLIKHAIEQLNGNHES
jgi:hypothetical protein